MRRNGMHTGLRRLCQLWLLLALTVLVQARAAEMTPREIVLDASSRMIAALKADRELVKREPRYVYALVEDILLPHFDFEAMSKWVLGKYWRTMSKEQTQRFTEEFRSLLVRTYAVSLANYQDEPYEVLSEQPRSADGSQVEVRTEVKIKGPYPIPINYSMHRKNDRWKVYDVSFDGVSLLVNYRTSFTSEIRQGGPDTLINKLASLNRHEVK